MFHNFFSSLAKSENLFIFSFSFIFILWSARTAKSVQWQVLLFLLINTMSGLLKIPFIIIISSSSSC